MSDSEWSDLNHYSDGRPGDIWSPRSSCTYSSGEPEQEIEPGAAAGQLTAGASSAPLPEGEPSEQQLQQLCEEPVAAPAAPAQYVGRCPLGTAPAADCRDRYYVVWSVPGHAALAGLHVGIGTRAFYSLCRFFPGGRYETGGGVAFCRADSPDHADLLYRQSARKYGCPEPACWFRWV